MFSIHFKTRGRWEVIDLKRDKTFFNLTKRYFVLNKKYEIKLLYHGFELEDTEIKI